MTSNLGCVGLGVPDAAALAELLAEVVPRSTATRQEDGSALYVWSDESGARLTVTTDRSGAIDDVTPSYGGRQGAELAHLVALHHAVVWADVRAEGQPTTRLLVEVLAPGPVPSSGPAAVTAFGLDVGVRDDAPGPSLALEAGDEEEPAPLARLRGTVLSCRTATVGVTGQAFHAVRVRTVGMEVDLCLAADEHPEAPEPGCVVGGLVYLVADVARPARTRRGWFARRDR